MSQSISFENVALKAKGKEGNIKRSPSGYYENIIVGAYGIHNSAGDFYSSVGIKDFFAHKSPFQQLVRSGDLRGEYGHPKREPGMSDGEWLSRIRRLEETRFACHYKRVELVDDLMVDSKTGKRTMGVVVDVAPSGPYGDAFERSMENPHENVCFSVRSITMDKITPSGFVKYLRHLTTWDVVWLHGIPGASKYNSPGMEDAGIVIEDGSPVVLDSSKMSRGEFLNVLREADDPNVGMEAGEKESLRQLYYSTFGDMGKEPQWMDW